MAKPSIFQPTPSLRRATTPRPSAPSPLTHFNPRPPCGGRRAGGRPADKEETYFNPRPPCGGRRRSSRGHHPHTGISTHALLAEGDLGRRPRSGCYYYFNPRPPCGGRPVVQLLVARFKRISTHALLAEGDPLISGSASPSKISTHALLAEGDASNREAMWQETRIFQPTPSLRRATRRLRLSRPKSSNFNPRPPCGGRHGGVRGVRGQRPISTHALLAEGDEYAHISRICTLGFQPTPSLRRATCWRRICGLSRRNFNPRPPCGGRRN